MPKKTDPIPTDEWRCPRCRELFSTPEAAADHLAAELETSQDEVRRLITVLLPLQRAAGCYCEPGTGIPRVPPHTKACREAVVAVRDLIGLGREALYRLGEYRRPYPDQHLTVIAPVGDPLCLLDHAYEDNVVLCDCGGTIIVDDNGVHPPGHRRCTDCGTPYTVASIGWAHGKPGPWKPGALTLLRVLDGPEPGPGTVT